MPIMSEGGNALCWWQWRIEQVGGTRRCQLAVVGDMSHMCTWTGALAVGGGPGGSRLEMALWARVWRGWVRSLGFLISAMGAAVPVWQGAVNTVKDVIYALQISAAHWVTEATRASDGRTSCGSFSSPLVLGARSSF